MTDQDTILLTGATGNIGARLLVELLGCGDNVRIAVLVRGKSEQDARNRLNANLRLIAPDLVDWGSTRSIEVLCGDITSSDLGLTPHMRERLIRSVTHVIHAAASTQWHLPLACARAVNVAGTTNMLQFAKEAHRVGRLQRFVYLSTAYVCGEKTGTIREIEHRGELRFANTYEQTKWEAEWQVTALRNDLPVTIIRPSITVGDSRTGLAVTFNVLYPPLRYILSGKLARLTCPPQNRLDLVPVDYVARAVAHLTLHSKPPSGAIFHLTAGPDRSLPIAEIVKKALSLAGMGSDRLPLTNSESSRDEAGATAGGNHKVMALMRLYASYLQIERDFDDTNTRAALKDSGIDLPHLSEYLEALLRTFICREIEPAKRRIAPLAAGGRP